MNCTLIQHCVTADHAAGRPEKVNDIKARKVYDYVKCVKCKEIFNPSCLVQANFKNSAICIHDTEDESKQTDFDIEYFEEDNNNETQVQL
ncbi:hypothetical protein HHI36_005737 [Cryptolaemus montrouzieri]|uniref:Uncharacterized protein n=1 Tax=Cryptolaemus montrouzieri TaxID=559131 RepID=A0ABD2NVH6_9CUCU